MPTITIELTDSAPSADRFPASGTNKTTKIVSFSIPKELLPQMSAVAKLLHVSKSNYISGLIRLDVAKRSSRI